MMRKKVKYWYLPTLLSCMCCTLLLILAQMPRKVDHLCCCLTKSGFMHVRLLDIYVHWFAFLQFSLLLLLAMSIWGSMLPELRICWVCGKVARNIWTLLVSNSTDYLGSVVSYPRSSDWYGHCTATSSFLWHR